MKIEINFMKKHIYFLTALIMVLAGAVLVIGYEKGEPSKYGHTADEIDAGSDGEHGAFGGDTLTIYSFPGYVGIGTTSPKSSLETVEVAGTNEVNLSGVVYVNSTSGNVGIGTESPEMKLEVKDGSIYVHGGTGGQGRVVMQLDGHDQFEWYPGTNGLELYDRTSENVPIFFGNDGKVGIGTSSPGAELDVRGSAQIHGSTVISSGADLDTYLHILPDADNDFVQIDGYGYTGGVASTPRNLILGYTGGNVGIGTADPGHYKLNVGGPMVVQYDGESHFFSPTGNTYLYIEPVADSHIRLGAYDSEIGGMSLVLNPSGGNVGIGTSPSEKLHVNGILRVGSTQIWDNEINRYNNDDLYIGYRNTANTILQPNGGNVGIGTTEDLTYKPRLHVRGSIGATGWIGAGCEGDCEVVGGYSILYPNGNIVNTGTLATSGSGSFGGDLTAGTLTTSGSGSFGGDLTVNGKVCTPDGNGYNGLCIKAVEFTLGWDWDGENDPDCWMVDNCVSFGDGFSTKRLTVSECITKAIQQAGCSGTFSYLLHEDQGSIDSCGDGSVEQYHIVALCYE